MMLGLGLVLRAMLEGGGGSDSMSYTMVPVSATVPYAGQVNCVLEVDLTGGAVGIPMVAMTPGQWLGIKVKPNGSNPAADNLTITPPAGLKLEIPTGVGAQVTYGTLGAANAMVILNNANQAGQGLLYAVSADGTFLELL